MNKTKFNRQLNETSNTQRNYRKNKTYVRCAVLEKSYENVANLQLMEIINAINIKQQINSINGNNCICSPFFFFSSSDLISWNTRSSLPFNWQTTILVQRKRYRIECSIWTRLRDLFLLNRLYIVNARNTMNFIDAIQLMTNADFICQD